MNGRFFGDVDPPVHAWAALRVYKIEKKRKGKGDRSFLQRIFHKLMLNFTWWVNRKDAEGMNIFQGGFSVWTTSAYSIAALPFLQVDISSSRMAPVGWRCTR